MLTGSLTVQMSVVHFYNFQPWGGRLYQRAVCDKLRWLLQQRANGVRIREVLMNGGPVHSWSVKCLLIIGDQGSPKHATDQLKVGVKSIFRMQERLTGKKKQHADCTNVLVRHIH